MYRRILVLGILLAISVVNWAMAECPEQINWRCLDHDGCLRQGERKHLPGQKRRISERRASHTLRTRATLVR